MKGALYVRVSGETLAELRRLTERDSVSLSTAARAAIERGLDDQPPQALMGLLGWCWQMISYMRATASPADQVTVTDFATAIRRYEVALGVRDERGASAA